MTQTVKRMLNDSAFARWSALVLIALMMFFGYMFVDVLSPLQEMLTETRGWSGSVFGIYGGSEFFLNIFAFFLIFAGIILDKMGVRFSGFLAGGLMVLGAGIKLYGLSDYFVNGGFGYEFLNSFWTGFPASAKLACIGFAVFGCGVEMAGVTVSRAIVKWFSGKEMALAMGLEMAIARLGVFAVLRMSPWVANVLGEPSVVRPVAICAILLCVGVLCFAVFALMDKKLDSQNGGEEKTQEDEFKIKDLGILLTSKPFLVIACLCVLYYSAIFPFQRFGTSLLSNTVMGLGSDSAAKLLSWFPIGAMALTPFLGALLDYKGRGATMLIIGAILLCTCHLIFAFAPLTINNMYLSYGTIILLGISFSLVPASLWPSVPKLVKERYLGSAYSVIFWIQNVGLFLTPVFIGWLLEKTNPGVTEMIQNKIPGAQYDYTEVSLVFASFGILAIFFAIWLKRLDAKWQYGLELPNVKKK